MGGPDRLSAAPENEDERLRLVIDTIPTMAWSLRPDGVVDFVNQRWLDYTGITLSEAIADSNRVIHPDDGAAVVAHWLSVKEAGKPYEQEIRLRRADGAYRWFLVRVVPLANAEGRILKWYGTSTDIEDRVRAEERLRDAAASLQALSRRLVEVQEFERRELARELHDRVGQTLTALNLNLAILRQGLPAADAALKARLEDSALLVESSMASIGNVLADLRPQMLDDHGLRAALEWYGAQFSARSGIAVSLHAGNFDARLEPEVEIALFRIAQEALNNVAKHARAGRIDISLGGRRNGFALTVEDDGVGMDAAADPPARPGLGIVTMKERAQAVGGALSVESFAGRGTRLTVRLPGWL